MPPESSSGLLSGGVSVRCLLSNSNPADCWRRMSSTCGQVKQGWLGWCVFDVYPDRVVIHQKSVYFAYERPEPEAFYNFNYGQWTRYKEAL